MTTFTEGNLKITFPRGTKARKFDDGSHGLSHCMKAVDFIVEENDRILFIEFKDLEHPDAPEENRIKDIKEFKSGNLDKELQYKYRDTFLYEWASDNIDKPIYYWVLVAIETLTAPDLSARTDDLKRKLPLDGSPSGKWTRPIVADCMVFNIETWNRSQPRFRLSRIS